MGLPYRTIVGAFSIFAANTAFAGDWPVTVQEAVRDLAPQLSLAEKLKIKLTAKKDIVSLYTDLGTGIRNHYGLWKGNEKLMLSACGRLCHPDDASLIIVEALWREFHRAE
jgi:hypothetical protein